MPVIRTGETDADKELARWDTPKRLGGERPDGYEPFPKMLYRAIRRDDGKVICIDVDPKTGAMLPGTTKIVKDERELAVAKGQGWAEHPVKALEAFEQGQQAIAQAAAEEAYRLERMSPKAQAEHAAANADTMEHVVEVPIPKLRRSHHKSKTQPVPA